MGPEVRTKLEYGRCRPFFLYLRWESRLTCWLVGLLLLAALDWRLLRHVVWSI